jgi:hypothetical protein
MEMTRSGYNRSARNLPRQLRDDPRKHLDARMNELLDALYKIPSINAADTGPHHSDPNDIPEGVGRSAPQDLDRPPAQMTHEPGLDRARTSGRGRGAARDRSSPTPSVVVLARIGRTQAERATA